MIKQSISEVSINSRVSSAKKKPKKKIRRNIDFLYEEFKLRLKGHENKIQKTLENTGVFEAFDVLLEVAQIKPTANEYNNFEIDLTKSQFTDFIKASENWFLKNRPKFLRIPPLRTFNLKNCLLLFMTIHRDYSVISTYKDIETYDRIIRIEKKMTKFLRALEDNRTLADMELSKESFLEDIVSINDMVNRLKNLEFLSKFCTEASKFYSAQKECFLSVDSRVFIRSSLPCITSDLDRRFHRDGPLKKQKIHHSDKRTRTLPPYKLPENAQLTEEIQLRAKLTQVSKEILQVDEDGNTKVIAILKEEALELKKQILKLWNKETTELSTDFTVQEVKNDLSYLSSIADIEEQLRNNYSKEQLKELEGYRNILTSAWNGQTQENITLQATGNFNYDLEYSESQNAADEKTALMRETFGSPLDFREKVDLNVAFCKNLEEDRGQMKRRNDSEMTFAPKSVEESFELQSNEKIADTNNQESRDNSFIINFQEEKQAKSALLTENSISLNNTRATQSNVNQSQNVRDNTISRENKKSEGFAEGKKNCIANPLKKSLDSERDPFLRNNLKLKSLNSDDMISLQKKLSKSNSSSLLQKSQSPQDRKTAVKSTVSFRKGIGFKSNFQSKPKAQKLSTDPKPPNLGIKGALDKNFQILDSYSEEKVSSFKKLGKSPGVLTKTPSSFRTTRSHFVNQKYSKKLEYSPSHNIDSLNITKNQDNTSMDFQKEKKITENKAIIENSQVKPSPAIDNQHLGIKTNTEEDHKSNSSDRIKNALNSEIMCNQIEEKVKEAMEIYKHLLNDKSGNEEKIKQAGTFLSSLLEVVKTDSKDVIQSNIEEIINKIFIIYSIENDYIDLGNFLQFCKDVKLVKAKYSKPAKRFSDKKLVKFFDAFSNFQGEMNSEMFKKTIVKLSESYYDVEFDLIYNKKSSKLSSSQKLFKFCEKMKRNLSNLIKT